MTVSIVEEFEVVEIHHRDRDSGGGRLGRMSLHLKALVESSMIEQSRERIAIRSLNRLRQQMLSLLEKLLGYRFHFLALGDIVSNHQTRLLITELKCVRVYLDPNLRAIFVQMAPGASDLRRYWRKGEALHQCSKVIGRTNISEGHLQKLFARISIPLRCGVIYREKRECADVVNPHGLGICLEK